LLQSFFFKAKLVGINLLEKWHSRGRRSKMDGGGIGLSGPKTARQSAIKVLFQQN
jgi:hypothetical protein